MKKPIVRKQSGIALLSVLFALTLMVLMAGEVTLGFTNLLRKTSTSQFMEQARWYALSSEQLLFKALKEDFSDDKTVHLDQLWATENTNFPVDNGSIQATVKDAQACLNLNALIEKDKEGVPPDSLKMYQALLELLNIDPYQADIIVQSTRDWIDTDDTIDSGTGAEDMNYQMRALPYLASNTAMRDVSELRAVNGVSARTANRIQDYLCALPTSELKININTLSVKQPALLSALFLNDLPIEQAQDILNQRPKKGWDSVDAFLNDPLVANFQASALKELMAVDSHYFELSSTATVSGIEAQLTSLIRRVDNQTFTVIRRQFGDVK